MFDKQRKKLVFLSLLGLVLAVLTFMGCPRIDPFCPDCDPAVAQPGCPGALDNVIPGQWIVRYSDATDSLGFLPEFTVVLHSDGGDTISLDSFLTSFDTTLLANTKFELLGSTPELLDDLNNHFLTLKDPADTLTQNDVLLLKSCGCRMALFWINPIKIDLNTSVEQATNQTRTQDNGIPGKVTSVDVNRWVTFGPDVDNSSPEPTGRSCNERDDHPDDKGLRSCSKDSLNNPFTPVSLAEDTLTVAVIDSGLDYLHNDLDQRQPSAGSTRSAVWVNRLEMDNGRYGSQLRLDDWNSLMRTQPQSNCYYGDLIGYNFLHDNNRVDDRQGHGTHVGGVIATAMDVDSAVRVMPLKIAGYVENNGQEEFTADLFSVLCGMEYAIEKDVSVINMSLGYYAPIPNAQLRQLVTLADSADILIVASVGNDSLNIDCCQHWPSNLSDTCSNVISVGAWDVTLASTPLGLAPYSNYGNKVNIAAPGTKLMGPATGTGFQQIDKSGTSMAAALISRQAILIRNSGARPSAAKTKDLLMSTNTGNGNTICVGNGLYYDYTQYPDIWNIIGYSQ